MLVRSDPLSYIVRLDVHGRYSHTWAWCGGSAVMTPIFEICDPIGSPFYTSTQSDGPLRSAESIGLSLSHLVPEILGPKFGLIVHQNVLFNDLSFLY